MFGCRELDRVAVEEFLLDVLRECGRKEEVEVDLRKVDPSQLPWPILHASAASQTHRLTAQNS
jgi:hypothetical protein